MREREEERKEGRKEGTKEGTKRRKERGRSKMKCEETEWVMYLSGRALTFHV
jgi:hypothetical protein